MQIFIKWLARCALILLINHDTTSRLIDLSINDIKKLDMNLYNRKKPSISLEYDKEKSF